MVKWLQEYVNPQVYADIPQTLNEKLKIRCVIAGIRPQLLEKVFENWTSYKQAVGPIMLKKVFKHIWHILLLPINALLR